MNTKLATNYLLLFLFLFLLPSHSFADTERKELIVALVTRVDAPQPKRSVTVTLTMIIHSPDRFAGSQFMLVTESEDRSKIRAEFPIGSLQAMELPAKTVKELEEQIDARISVDRQLDQGINPLMISQLIFAPTVKFVELPTKPTASTVVTK